MSPPRRYRDDSSAPPELQRLAREGRRTRAMPADVRARSSARIDKLVLAPAVAATVFVWIKGVAIAAIGSGAVVVAVRVAPLLVVGISHGAPPSPSTHEASGRGPSGRAPSGNETKLHDTVSARPSNTVLAPPFSAPLAAPTVLRPPGATPPAVRTTAAPSAHAAPEGVRSDPPPAPSDSLAQEASLLEQARAGLDGNPRQALATLDRHAALFPDGHLVMEREILAVEALQRLGQKERARDRALSLLERARGSIYQPRVEAMIEELSAP
jgi:hypothetical protein